MATDVPDLCTTVVNHNHSMFVLLSPMGLSQSQGPRDAHLTSSRGLVGCLRAERHCGVEVVTPNRFLLTS